MRSWLGLADMPEWLAAPVRSAWADLQKDGPLPSIYPCAGTDDPELPGMYWVGLSHDPNSGGAVSGGGVTVDDSLAEILVIVADNMQCVLFEMDEAWLQARPRCPHHSSALNAVLLDGEAWWFCQSRDERVARIGSGAFGSGGAPPEN